MDAIALYGLFLIVAIWRHLSGDRNPFRCMPISCAMFIASVDARDLSELHADFQRKAKAKVRLESIKRMKKNRNPSS